ncbi:gamma-glutamyltransferase [Aestuariispira insulae]|uniref:Glutathione hydrolase proenzyme n=1 Tax=Aestuariispira insulae TaxID=1461337 RepID=A0A3D9HN47_9PROT|nr:gamma-glutamyltransferase [Aestuariispira insulae]RED50731.1 gamma-glutamyltransferase 1 [Aestuariispira insulae]
MTWWTGIRRTAACMAALLAATPLLAQDIQPEETYGRQDRTQSVSANDFMIAAAHPAAVKAGYDVLKDGGTAVDAAIAAQMVLNLVEPQSSGIGGGAFLLYWDAKSRSLQAFDGRETAPFKASPGYFLGPDGQPKGFWEAVIGGRSVGVPGTVRMLETAHRIHGKQAWKGLFEPAITLAKDGFEISPRMASSIAGSAGEKRQLDRFPEARAYFFEADGSPKKAGTLLKNPEFADTLQLIAERGADVFYKGEIARDIVKAVSIPAENPGILTLLDLERYQAKIRTPVCLPYRGYEVCGMGPPTSGGLSVGQILGVLSHFNLPGQGPNSDSVHQFVEAAKLAYADRALYIADADYVSVPSSGLLDPAYLTTRAQRVNRNKAMEKAIAGNPPWKEASLRSPDTDPERPGTSHLVIRDSYGNALSMTTTIETGFGSRIMVRGFLLNNELTDFSRAPEADGRPIANRVEGGKRPRSSMAPTIVMKDGEPYLLVGSPGGSRIINYVAKTIVAILDWGMHPQQAVSLGHFVNRNGATDLEEGTEAVQFKGILEAMGHEVKIRNLNSGLHAILIHEGGLSGGADPRREGTVMGD